MRLSTPAALVGFGAIVAGLWAAPAHAQTTLTLSATSVTFPVADPDTTASIAAPPLGVTIRTNRNSWQLTVIAGGDLTSGASTIPISNISWTASPTPPFQDGVMSRTVAQLVASGNAPVNPAQTATVIYYLVNSWTYDVGTYTATITYTFTAV